MRDDCGHSSSRGDLAGMNHDAELHQGGVDFSGTLERSADCVRKVLDFVKSSEVCLTYCVQDIDIVVSNTFYNLDL